MQNVNNLQWTPQNDKQNFRWVFRWLNVSSGGLSFLMRVLEHQGLFPELSVLPDWATWKRTCRDTVNRWEKVPESQRSLWALWLSEMSLKWMQLNFYGKIWKQSFTSSPCTTRQSLTRSATNDTTSSNLGVQSLRHHTQVVWSTE